jgi:radical SAM superfamily enzyme YgiQ (UPF0313 family)
MNYSFWYQKIFPALSGFGLWLRGGELNTVPAAEFDRRPFRVLIARLSTWRDTADSFTHRLLYQIVSRIEGAFPDLAYLPPPKDAALFDADRVPWLLGATSKRPGRDFTVIALSVSIVQELPNIPVMLRKSGIPLSKRERMNDPVCPLVILGGASALFTSSLFTGDPAVDGIFIGEDPRTIGRLFEIGRDSFQRKTAKEATLEALRSVPGFFEPDRNRSAEIFQAPELPQEQLLETGPVLYEEACIGTANLQISEGCRYCCSFCAESFGRKPYREFDAPRLYAAALRQKAATGAHTAELYSFNFSTHHDFYRLLHDLSKIFPSIRLKSQRIDSIAADPAMVQFLHAVNKTSITCGIEGISPRLRRYLNKSLDEKELLKGLAVLLAAPLRELKIFLIATGLEQQGDYDEFRKLLTFVEKAAHAGGRTPRIIFSMTILVRFPWTPLEFEDAPDPSVCQAVLNTAGRLVRAAGFEFRASADASDYWLSQILVRAEEPRVGTVILQAQDETGFVYYRGFDRTFVRAVRKSLERSGVQPETLLRGHAPQERAARPWAGLMTGVRESFLIRQWRDAARYEDTGCGAEQRVPCVLKLRPYTAEELRDELDSATMREVPLTFRVRIGSAMAGIPHALRNAALARALMLADARMVEGYRGFRPSALFNGGESDWVVGDDRLVLVWSPAAAALVRDGMGDTAFIEKINTLLAGWETLVSGSGGGSHDPVSIQTVIFRSPFRFDLSAYCRNNSLKFTLRKTAPGSVSCALPKESLKKKILDTCTATETPDGRTVVSVTPGPKFDPEEFARTAFKLPAENEWVRIAMTAERCSPASFPSPLTPSPFTR